MKTCPRCSVSYSDYPALSRVDNKTDICPKCGTDEALFNWQYPERDLPPLNQRAVP